MRHCNNREGELSQELALNRSTEFQCQTFFNENKQGSYKREAKEPKTSQHFSKLSTMCDHELAEPVINIIPG